MIRAPVFRVTQILINCLNKPWFLIIKSPEYWGLSYPSTHRGVCPFLAGHSWSTCCGRGAPPSPYGGVPNFDLKCHSNFDGFGSRLGSVRGAGWVPNWTLGGNFSHVGMQGSLQKAGFEANLKDLMGARVHEHTHEVRQPPLWGRPGCERSGLLCSPPL